MKFNKIYKVPFKQDGSIIWSIDKKTTGLTRAFDLVQYRGKSVLWERIIEALNGKKVKFYKFNPNKLVNKYDSFIQYEGKNFISIRGWGELTGTLKISETKAAKMQDDFADWIIKTLKENKL